MNTNDFINILLNNREKIVDNLIPNYSYGHLLKIFQQIDAEREENIEIVPKDRYLYRLMTGEYEGCRYDKSAIDWLPSEELVDGILKLAEHYRITSIEEIDTGMGILSKFLSEKNKNIKITTADTFENIKTCNKLDLVPIAKRNAYDYRYYSQLNEPFPEMVISTYYPDFSVNEISNDCKYINEISELVKDNNHKIIILLLPYAFLEYHHLFYHITTQTQYTINSYYVKALDKYFSVMNLLKDHYPLGMVAHIFVRKNNGFDDNILLSYIFQNAICNNSSVDTHCKLVQKLIYFYVKVSFKLIKNIYQSYNFIEPNRNNKELSPTLTQLQFLVDVEKIIIPQYIYTMNEFIFWSECYTQNLYFVFENRVLFYQFYTEAIRMKISEIRRQINIPHWIRSRECMLKYIYLQTINYPGNWKNNKNSFDVIFDALNNKNKNALKM